MIAVTNTINADSSFFIINPAYYGCVVAFKNSRYLRVCLVCFHVCAIHGLAAYCDDALRRVVRDKGFIAYPPCLRLLLYYLFDCFHRWLSY
jgi:hypothetical protein